jgi:hypothetical protein
MADQTTKERLDRIERMAESGLKHGAAQLSRLILEQDPQNVEALVWLARTSGQPDEVKKATEYANRLQPDNPAVRELNYTANRMADTTPFSSQSFTPNAYSSLQTAPNPYATPSANPYATPNSSYDYLRNVGPGATIPNATVAPPPMPVTPLKPEAKVRRGPNIFGLILGLLLFIGGLAGAVWWGLNVANFNATGTSQPQGQVTRLTGSGDVWTVVIQVPNQGERRYKISKRAADTLTPLIADRNNLAPNSVRLNVNEAGRLQSLEVLTPNRGTVSNPDVSLLDFGSAIDWLLAGLGVVVGLIGLLILGAAANRKTT